MKSIHFNDAEVNALDPESIAITTVIGTDSLLTQTVADVLVNRDFLNARKGLPEPTNTDAIDWALHDQTYDSHDLLVATSVGIFRLELD